MWPFKRKQEQAVEARSAGVGFIAEIISARASYIAGTRGIAELTATVQSCVSLWENGFALADVTGTDMLTRPTGRARSTPRRQTVRDSADSGLAKISGTKPERDLPNPAARLDKVRP